MKKHTSKRSSIASSASRASVASGASQVSERRSSLSMDLSVPTGGIQPRAGKDPEPGQLAALPRISREVIISNVVPTTDRRWFAAPGYRWEDSGFNVIRVFTGKQECCLEYKGYHDADWECLWVGRKRQNLYEDWPVRNLMCRFHVIEWMNTVENFPSLSNTPHLPIHRPSLRTTGSSRDLLAKSSPDRSSLDVRSRSTSTYSQPSMLEQQFTMQNFGTLPSISADRLTSVSPLDRQWYRLKGSGFNAVRRLVGADRCVMSFHADEEWECVTFKEGILSSASPIPTKLQRWITAHYCADCVLRKVSEYQAKPLRFKAQLSTVNQYKMD